MPWFTVQITAQHATWLAVAALVVMAHKPNHRARLHCYTTVATMWPLQDQASQSLGTFSAEPESGTIPAKGSKVITLNLQATRLGRIQLPVYVRVAGSKNKPLQLVADAKAVGPWLDFAVKPKAARAASSSCGAPAAAEASDATATAGAGEAAAAAGAMPGTLDGGSLPALHAEVSSASQLTTASKAGGRKGKGPKEPAAPQWAAGASIKFDKVQVLQPHSQVLLLRNTTHIAADVKLFVEGRDSVFEVGTGGFCLHLHHTPFHNDGMCSCFCGASAHTQHACCQCTSPCQQQSSV